MDPDRYVIATQGPEVELKVKGSRFLAQVFPAPTMDEAKIHLAAVRKAKYSATHHCWAVLAGNPGQVKARSDDDGEPSGTAGAPMLVRLERSRWYSVMVVVTRYYGGTKLGTGGLAKAYGQAAGLALEATEPQEQFLFRMLSVTVPFPDLGTVEALIGKNGQAILQVEREFGDASIFQLRLKASRAEAIGALIAESTAGRAVLTWT